jgi:hypothetical protein
MPPRASPISEWLSTLYKIQAQHLETLSLNILNITWSMMAAMMGDDGMPSNSCLVL